MVCKLAKGDEAPVFAWVSESMLMQTPQKPALRQWPDEGTCVPKAIVGDEVFVTDVFVL